MQITSIPADNCRMPAKRPERRNQSSAAFYAVYYGISMHPTLREPEVMEVTPCGDRPLQVGDVAYFRPPGWDRSIVHRVIRITPAGIVTCGDNSNQEDVFLLGSHNIEGLVTTVWRGRRGRRKIAGGWQGRLTRRWIHCRNALANTLRPILSSCYQGLTHWQLSDRMLPAALLPRVVIFSTDGKDQLQLYMGRYMVGQYNADRQKWQIRRPLRLLVNAAKLPGPDQSNGPDQTLLSPSTQTAATIPVNAYDLQLADGNHWHISAQNPEGAAIVARLGSVMGLKPSAAGNKNAPTGDLRRLAVKVASPVSVADCYMPVAKKTENDFLSVLCPDSHWGSIYVNLVRLSLIIADQAQTAGGVLIHGALAERSGMGVILAAPGGTGKTTASNRLCPPWQSRCDDATLVVRDAQGCYWAHPWPTWSRFINDGPGGVWDVQRAIPLKGIFFLARAKTEKVERIGPGQATGRLVDAVRQASMFMAQCFSPEEIRMIHLQKFHNICALSEAVPSHILHLGLTGAFWTEIEQVLSLEPDCNG